MDMTTEYCEFLSERGCSIFTLNPSVNDVEWAEIENIGNNILTSIESTASPAVVVDLTELEYMGSAMVALIVRVWKKVEKQNGKMVVDNSHHLVYEVLKLAGLTKMWTIVTSREEAIQELGGKNAVASGGNLGMVLLGMITVIGALVGLGLLMSGSELLPQKIVLVIQFGFAAVGIAVGTLLFSKSVGSGKGIGLLVIVACLAIVVLGIVKFPPGDAALPPENKLDTQSGETNTPAAKEPAPEEEIKPETPNTDKPADTEPKNKAPEQETKPADETTQPTKQQSEPATKKPE